MKKSLTALLDRADIQGHNTFHLSEFPHLDENVALPFLTRTTCPSLITCSGCHESCSKPIQQKRDQLFIWCDEPPQLGAVIVEPEELHFWTLSLEQLSQEVATLLSQPTPQTIIRNRLYDIGVIGDHTLFIMAGISWDDADLIFNDSSVCNSNPLLLTLSPAPKDLPYPTLWLGQLLDYRENALTVDSARLAMHTHTTNTPAPNINQFQQMGKGWRINYDSKEILLPDSKGAAYIQHLLLHPNKEFSAIDLQVLKNKPTENAIIPFEQENDTLTDSKAIRDAQNRIEYLIETNPESNQIEELELFIKNNQHKGKLKSFNSNNSKARIAVTNAINRTIKQIDNTHPTLAAHLKLNIQRGVFCSYKPGKINSWQHP